MSLEVSGRVDERFDSKGRKVSRCRKPELVEIPTGLEHPCGRSNVGVIGEVLGVGGEKGVPARFEGRRLLSDQRRTLGCACGLPDQAELVQQHTQPPDVVTIDKLRNVRREGPQSRMSHRSQATAGRAVWLAGPPVPMRIEIAIILGIMERIIVQVDDADLAELDAVGEEEALSRSALVRRAIALLLAERRRQRELDAVIASYRKEPPEDLVASAELRRRAWPD